MKQKISQGDEAKSLKAVRTLNTKLLGEKLVDAGFDDQERHVIQILISQTSNPVNGQDTKSAEGGYNPELSGASSVPHLTERDRIKQAILDLHDEHYGVGHKSDLLNLDDVLAVIDDEEQSV